MHARPSLADCKVLVIEDEAVQTLDLEQSLLRLGCTVLGPVDTQAAAMDLLRRERPNVVLLDLMLRDGPALRLAERLQARRVPMAAVTGCDATLLDHSRPQGVPLLRKPFGPVALRTTVRGLFKIDLAASLARTEWRIEQGWDRVRVQAAIVGRLAAKGHDTHSAEELLLAFERTLAILESRRRHLLRLLEAQGGPVVSPR